MAGRPIRATIDLSALRANFLALRQLAGPRGLIAVVKADAYGHGSIDVSRTLLDAGCRQLAVLSVAEAQELREAGIAAPILVLAGVHSPAEASQAAALHLTTVLHDEDGLGWLSEAAPAGGSPLRVHVEVDTGMRRMGVPVERAVRLCQAVREDPGLDLDGVFTHFACADDRDLSFSQEQQKRFRGVLERLEQTGPLPSQIHADNSAALLQGPALSNGLPQATAVRPGLALYGVQPGPDAAVALRPVMTLLSKVVAVRDLAPGASVGYGATFRAAAKTRIATLAGGYADGVPCATANRGAVWLAGARRPVVGRVSMDYTGVDVGNAPVEVGDEAIFFGAGAEGGLLVEDAAVAAGTIAYELLVRVGARVPRTTLSGPPSGRVD